MRFLCFGLLLALAGLLTSPPVPAQQPPGHPTPGDFPAKDSHEGVTIAVVPILDTPEAEKVFGLEAAPTRAGFLPVEFIVFNHREKTLEMELDGIAIFSGPDRFEMVEPETVALGLHPKPEQEIKDPTEQKRRKWPSPIPRGPKKPPKDKKKEIRETASASLRRHQLRSGQVLPGGYARGYLYFDLRRASIDVENATVYIPKVTEKKSKKRLTFFEISLKPYALE